MSLVVVLQRLEGLGFALVGLWLYKFSGVSWWLFLVLVLAPDLAMLGYLAGRRIGALTYDIFHTYTAPILFGALGWYAPVLFDPIGWHPNSSILLAIAFVWMVHIGADRALGYGLKLPSGFRDTHLGRIGKPVG